MDKLFSYLKKDNSHFEKKEEYLNQLIPNISKEEICFGEEPQKGYEDLRWIEKSNSIKALDNYTCQLCHSFNPSIGNPVFIKQGEYETAHQYYWAGDSYYNISVKGYLLTITFHFNYGYHLVMPQLNVHHKVYYKNRELWDYQDNELVTLCEDCHHYIHSLKNIGIPIVEQNANGNIELVGRTQPKSYNPIFDHTDLGTFKPFALVKENLWGIGLNGKDLSDFNRAKRKKKQWYDYQELLDDKVVNISYFTSHDRKMNNYSPEEIKEVADFIIHDFVENILGFRKMS